jgi:hypothetical protein
MTKKLSKRQAAMMRTIAWSLCEYDGFAPHTAGEHRTARSLVDLGLARHIGLGECGDGCERAGDCPHSVEIYTFTDEGKRYMEEVQP